MALPGENFDPAAEQIAWLTLRRTAPDDVKERELFVSLDGKRIAILVYGDVAAVSITPGHHELRIHNTISRKKVAFDAAPGQHVRFKTANVAGKGFAYSAFFLGVAMLWTRIERDEDGPRPTVSIPPTFRV